MLRRNTTFRHLGSNDKNHQKKYRQINRETPYPLVEREKKSRYTNITSSRYMITTHSAHIMKPLSTAAITLLIINMKFSSIEAFSLKCPTQTVSSLLNTKPSSTGNPSSLMQSSFSSYSVSSTMQRSTRPKSSQSSLCMAAMVSV